jgi:hypothetical protein
MCGDSPPHTISVIIKKRRMVTDPRTAELQTVELPRPIGEDERLVGSAVMGLPFASCHYLAMRNWAATSFAPPYRAVFHRTPAGRWTIWSNAEPQNGCGRFWSAAVHTIDVVDIRIDWQGPNDLVIEIPEVDFRWDLCIDSSPTTGMMSRMATVLPNAAWESDAILKLMSGFAGPFLGIGKVNMVGHLPNGQHFQMAPRKMWRIMDSTAVLGRTGFGRPGRLLTQLTLGEVWLPQEGIFAVGSARTDAYDPEIHHSALATLD